MKRSLAMAEMLARSAKVLDARATELLRQTAELLKAAEGSK